ncbi:hypothetical protein [Brassicibacter mesophilus]|uniref:hypothetical protein n=1 Tax=Brassicibacter mesophilus TaxID=745119 RepID=UPI003D25171F
MAKKRRSGSARRKAKQKANWKREENKLLGRQFQYGENILHKDDIIRLVGKNEYYILKKGGYLEAIQNAEKGHFKSTEKFRREFKLHVDGKAKFGGSGSTVHAKGVNNIINILPDKAKLEGRVSNETELKDEFKQLKTTDAYKIALKEEKERLENQIKQIENDYRAHKIDEATYLIDRRNTRNDLKIINDNKRGVSHSDFRVKLTRNEAEETLERLRDERLKVSESYRKQFDKAIVKMENIISRSTTTSIELNIEIVTANYEYKDIKAKENYETLTGKEIIYLPAY